VTDRNLSRKLRLRLLKGILFDLDGVVADTEDLHRQAYNLTFEEAGVPVRWTEKDYRDRLLMSGGSKLRTIEIPAEIVGAESFLKGLYGRKRHFYLELLRTAPLPPRPGVVRLVTQALKAGVLLAAASTCAKEGARAILERVLGDDLTARFKTVKAGDDAKKRKPAPDIYLLAIEGLGVSASRCVAIEDSRHGMLAAKAAGLWTLVTPSQYTRGDDFSEADLVVEDLDRGNIDPETLDGRLSSLS